MNRQFFDGSLDEVVQFMCVEASLTFPAPPPMQHFLPSPVKITFNDYGETYVAVVRRLEMRGNGTRVQCSFTVGKNSLGVILFDLVSPHLNAWGILSEWRQVGDFLTLDELAQQFRLTYA